ncbi:MAG: DUF2259 domain-containing protein [Spirochaetia bacterium]
MKKTLSVIILAAFLCMPVVAGDIATFLNLGFSEDSRYFMFGQYGVQTPSGHPYGDIFIVNVRDNNFVENGVFSREFSHVLEPGQNAIGAFLELYSDAEEVSQSRGVNHLETGKLLYLLLNGDRPRSVLNFRDFETGYHYSVSLMQNSRGEGDDVESAFHIQLTVTDDTGYNRNFTVGLPNYYRDHVRGYTIRQILISPDAASLVFVLEKQIIENGEVNIRYMVETVRAFS